MLFKILFAVLLLAGNSLSAWAAGFDGSAPTIYCAFTKVLECEGKKGCESVSPEEVSLPPFVRIELQKNSIVATQGEKNVTTEIKNLQRKDGNIILQGMEKRAWILTIAEKTGKLTLAVAGDEDGFVVFGTCMAP